MFGSSVVPDLLETMKSVLREVDLALRGLHLGGIGRVEHVSSGYPVLPPEGEREQLGEEARAAHPEQQRVLEAGFARRRARSRSSRSECASWSSAIPSQPSHRASSAPVQSVASRAHRRRTFAPASQSSIVAVHLGLDLRRAGSRAGRCGLREAASASLCGDRREQLRERLVEQLHAVLGQLVGDLVERDAEPGERRERVVGGVDALLEARARAPVLPKGLERSRRHRVDGVRADQLLDVEQVGVSRGSSCPCSPTAAAARARLARRAPASAR